MILTINQSSEEPLYLQIRTQIIAAIARGELEAGDPLPSVRKLASDLGVNLHTVNKAYAVLRDEGYVAMRGRSGAVIADYPATASPQLQDSADAALQGKLQQIAWEFRARGGSQQEFVDLAARVFSSTNPSSESEPRTETR